MYLKIAGNQNDSQHNIKDFSLGLVNNEKIIVFDKSKYISQNNDADPQQSAQYKPNIDSNESTPDTPYNPISSEGAKY